MAYGEEQITEKAQYDQTARGVLGNALRSPDRFDLETIQARLANLYTTFSTAVTIARAAADKISGGCPQSDCEKQAEPYCISGQINFLEQIGQELLNELNRL